MINELSSAVWINDYDPPNDELIGRSLGTIRRFISPSPLPSVFNEKYLSQAYEIASFAASHFSTISTENIEAMKRIARSLAEPALPRLVQEPYRNTYMQKYKTLFAPFAPPLPEPPKETALDAEVPLEKMPFVQLISQFWKDIALHYLPKAISGNPNSFIYRIAPAAVPLLDKCLPQIALQYFAQKPRLISHGEKKSTSFVLNQIIRFFQNYNNAIQGKNGTVELSEDELVAKLAPLMPGFKNDTLLNAPDYDFFYNHTLELLQRLVVASRPPCDQTLDDLVDEKEVLAVVCALEAMFAIFSPASFALLITRLMDDSFALQAPAAPLPEDKTPEDKSFSLSTGQYIRDLAAELIKLGEPDGTASGLLWIIEKVISTCKASIGAKVQKTLNDATQSEFTIRPFIILHHLLFRKEKGELIPTLLNQSGHDGQRKNIQQAIFEKLFPLIKTKIAEYSVFGAALAGKMSSVEKFTQKLAFRLWNISQQEKVLKILLTHILYGFYEASGQTKSLYK